MKKLQLFALLMTIQLLVIYDVQAQTYDTGDTTALGVIRDNNFVEDDPLNWSDSDPANWLGVIWDDSEPKRVIQLDLSGDGNETTNGGNGGTEWGIGHDFQTEYSGFMGTGIETQLEGPIDFSSLSELVAIDLGLQSGITDIDVNGLQNLQYFYFTGNDNCTSINLSNLSSLIIAEVYDNPVLESLDVSNCPSLIRLKVAFSDYNGSSNCILNELSLEGSNALRQLTMKWHNLITLDVSGKSELQMLVAPGRNLKEVVGLEDLSKLRRLTISSGLQFSESNGILETLDMSNFDLENFYTISAWGHNIHEIVGLDDLLARESMLNLVLFDNALSLSNAVAIEDFQGTIEGWQWLVSPQIRYGGFAEIVPVSLDYSNEALITTSGGDVATTFTLFNDEDTQIDQNTTGLFEITDDEDADVYYVTMENSGVTLITNNITVLPGGSSVLNASLSDDDFEAFIGQSDAQTLTVENAGDEALEITDITLPHEDFSIDATTATIAAGGSEDFTVTFVPTKDSVYVGDLEIVSDADAGDNIFELAGIGLEPASVISASLSSSDFGTVLAGETSIQTMTVENTGVLGLEITDIVMPDAFSIGATIATIGAGESTEFEVTFSPDNTVSTIESYEGTIEIETDADEGGRFLGVSGTGIALSIINTAIDAASFGEVAIGSTQNQTLTITNASAVTINVSDIAVPEGFTIDATTAAIAGGSSATFTVTLTPTEETAYSGDIVVTSDASGGVSSVAVSGAGVIVLGIEDLMNQVASLYPNPAENGIIQLDGYFNELELSVFSLAGREVKSFLISGANNQIDLSDIRTGTYVVASPDMSFYQKVIKK